MDGSSSKTDGEENCSLAIKAKKRKGKASHSKSDSYHGGKKKDMTKFRCFHCHELGHFATNCPLKKSKKKSLGGAEGEAFASQFELEFSLIACMVSSMMGSVWYLDSGSSFHIIGDKELFNYLEEKYLQMHIEMGDDGKYSVTGLGTITFTREYGAPLTLKNVMYVPRLNKNMVSISMLEDRGYDVIFSKGKVFLRHIATGQKKDQTFTKFCEFKALVEKESGKKVKALWSNNYGEYVSNKFKNFSAVEVIKRELTAPHNPQQNGVAERKNRSIVGAVREMLHDHDLPLHLWAKTCNTMVYVQNHSPHQILEMKTPEEAYSGKRPDVGHFRIFGSLVYFHVTKDAWKKLEPTIELGIFVGYIDTPHNYLVYFSTNRMTVVRRDVRFDEEKAMRVPLRGSLTTCR
eukprot:PITA_20075